MLATETVVARVNLREVVPVLVQDDRVVELVGIHRAIPRQVNRVARSEERALSTLHRPLDIQGDAEGEGRLRLPEHLLPYADSGQDVEGTAGAVAVLRQNVARHAVVGSEA